MYGISKLIGAIAEWFADHWSYILTVVLTVIVMALSANWWYGSKIGALEKQIKEYEIAIETSNKKLEEVEKESKEYVTLTEGQIATLKSNLTTVETAYERLREEEKKKLKTQIVTVQVPGPEKIVEVPVYFNGNQEVVCSRFFDTFTESANEIINKVNSQLKGSP